MSFGPIHSSADELANQSGVASISCIACPTKMRREHFADDVAIALEIESAAKDDNRWRFSKFAFGGLLQNEADPRRIIEIIELVASVFKMAPSLPR